MSTTASAEELRRAIISLLITKVREVEALMTKANSLPTDVLLEIDYQLIRTFQNRAKGIEWLLTPSAAFQVRPPLSLLPERKNEIKETLERVGFANIL